MSTILEIGSKFDSWKEKSRSLIKGEDNLTDLSALGGDDNRELSKEEKWEKFKTSSKRFSWKQRLIGLGICWGIAVVFLIMAFTFGFAIISTFIIAYSLSNIFFILGSFFLISPRKQAKHICAPKRLIASIVYFGSLVLTVIFALALANIGAAVLMMIVQLCALFWYTISYIPYARTLIRNALPCCPSSSS